MFDTLTPRLLAISDVILSSFFQNFRGLRHLQSFPPRRSSDLCGLRLSSGGRGTGGSCIRRCTSGATPRSEEHTSELQSRRDLVCRLLLEKKKIGGNVAGVETLSLLPQITPQTWVVL